MATTKHLFVFAGLALILAYSTCLHSAIARDPFDAEARAHWAFQKVSRPALPPVRQTQWVRNPVDAFVLSELEAKGIPTAPPADKITLLRRAYLDLIGLPPTPKQIDAFLADKSP